MNEAYVGLLPVEVWRHFDALNRIPRPSGREAAARVYVEKVAADAGLVTRIDTAGNCVVVVPSRTGGGTLTAVQAHLDMVRATADGVVHNFDTDPITPRRDGDRICAAGTTLGADNGIGAAMALALATQPGLRTGPLELLFTVEEETGLIGAAALDPALVTAHALINLDSEDPSTVTIGCAGGETIAITLPLETQLLSAGADRMLQEIRVTGLKGGHSGVEIHERRANAIKTLSALLGEAETRGIGARVLTIAGGSAHNAIPREAVAVVCVPHDNVFRLGELVAERIAAERSAWGADEPDLNITLRDLPQSDEYPEAPVIAPAAVRGLIDLLQALPTGVQAMSWEFDGKVQTSDNLATISAEGAFARITVSLRSFVAADIVALRRRIQDLAHAAGAGISISSGYPSWQPNPNSALLAATTAAFERVTGKLPVVEVVHAGLECGVISAKVPGMEAVSFGPRIERPHTPQECVYPDTVDTIWNVLLELLSRLA